MNNVVKIYIVIKNGMVYEVFSNKDKEKIIKAEVVDLDTHDDIGDLNRITKKYQKIKDTMYPVKF